MAAARLVRAELVREARAQEKPGVFWLLFTQTECRGLAQLQDWAAWSWPAEAVVVAVRLILWDLVESPLTSVHLTFPAVCSCKCRSASVAKSLIQSSPSASSNDTGVRRLNELVLI